ncbi:HMG box-containing protein 1-like [Gigantopelta aegis]|uniref:HMG box-containing protein 1-like n=1 Tax=Gigantopelta aegis TaxID=1735272 RepID=UPI001B88D1D9|nr:HMG box-containing protein 1-like [Gigantopelta aegis]
MQEFLRTQGDTNHKIRLCPFEGCQKTFTSLPGLRYHVKSHDVNEKPFRCLKCRKSFKSCNGLRYHTSKTRCEECTDGHSEKKTKPASTDLVLPEIGGNMEKLHQLAIIATGPQSPLLQSNSPSWDRPSGPFVRTLDFSTSPSKTSLNDGSVKERQSSESEAKVTSSFPFPSSPKDANSDSALWSHSWPTAVWQCFMRGSFIKDLSCPEYDWQTAEELADQAAQSSVTTKSSQSSPDDQHSITHILTNPAPFLLDKIEWESDRKSVDLYFTADTGTKKFFHVLAQCPQSHPFFVRDKGWSSCSPHETVKLYGIPSCRLEEKDVCLPPSHPDACFSRLYENSESTNRMQLNSLDSSAVSALCSMAQHKRECQERLSPSIGQHTASDAGKNKQWDAGQQKAKRPMNAFMLFAKHFRLLLTNKFPGKDNRAISVMLGEEWKRLGLTEKAVFQEEAQKLARKTKQISPDCWKRKK